VSSALFVYLNVQLYGAVLDRDRFEQMWQGVYEYRQQVEGALLAHEPLPAVPAKLNPYLKSLRANADGSIILVPADEIAENAAIVLTPAVADGHVTWRCSARAIELNKLPATCRP
jgi:hypothetical protein